MAELQDPWKDVASKAEALGLKLKLHLEQEGDDTEDGTEEGSTKAVLEDFGRKLQDAFDSLGTAAKDPAVRSDFKDIGALLKEAITETFSSVSSDVGDTMKRATGRSSGDDDADASPAGDDSGGSASEDDA